MKMSALIKAIIKSIYNKLINLTGLLPGPTISITLFYSHHDPNPSNDPMRQKHPRLGYAPLYLRNKSAVLYA